MFWQPALTGRVRNMVLDAVVSHLCSFLFSLSVRLPQFLGSIKLQSPFSTERISVQGLCKQSKFCFWNGGSNWRELIYQFSRLKRPLLFFPGDFHIPVPITAAPFHTCSTGPTKVSRMFLESLRAQHSVLNFQRPPSKIPPSNLISTQSLGLKLAHFPECSALSSWLFTHLLGCVPSD